MSTLIKTHLADELRERILAGQIQPGEIISETYWAPKLGAAQSSIREALHLLAAEGLIRKKPGCSARVTNLTERDVTHAYEVREVLEGLAARILASARPQPDLAPLDSALNRMRSAIEGNQLRKAIEADLEFHLLLCELPGNAFLTRQLRQILVPLFAFTKIKATTDPKVVDAWAISMRDHEWIVESIRSGDPVFAESVTRHAIGQFVRVARGVWVGGKA